MSRRCDSRGFDGYAHHGSDGYWPPVVSGRTSAPAPTHDASDDSVLVRVRRRHPTDRITRLCDTGQVMTQA